MDLDSTFTTSGTGSLSFGSLAFATFGGLTGTGNLVLTNTAGTAVSLSVGTNNSSTTYSGALGDNGAGGALNKVGNGTLTLSGSDTYTGGTTVDAGTLCLTNADALAGGTSLTVGAGAALVFDSSPAPAPAAGSDSLTATPGAAVPEPGTWALMATALWSAAIYCRFSSPWGRGQHRQRGGHAG